MLHTGGCDEFPGTLALGNKVHCFCQNVTAFQNVSHESRSGARLVRTNVLRVRLRDGIIPDNVWVHSSFEENLNSTPMRYRRPSADR